MSYRLLFPGCPPILVAIRLRHWHCRFVFNKSSPVAKWRTSSRKLVRITLQETQNQNKKRDRNRESDDRLREIPEWLEEFTENPEDTEVLAPAHIFQDSDSERSTKVVTRPGQLTQIWMWCKKSVSTIIGDRTLPDSRTQDLRDQGVREPTLRRDQLVRREDLREDLQGNSEMSQPLDIRTDDSEVRADFSSIEGNYIYHHHHTKPRVQLYVPKEETFPIPLKYIDVARSTHTDLDVMQEKRIDDRKVDANRNLSYSWTGFTKFTLLKEEPPRGYMWSRERLTKDSNDYGTRSCMARSLDENWKAAQNRDKQEWKNEKPKLDNARRLRGIYYTEPWIHRNPWTCEEKIGKACGRGHAVQKGGSFQPPQSWLRSWMHLTRFQRQLMVVWWNLTNPQGNEWNLLHLKITKTKLQADCSVWRTCIGRSLLHCNTEGRKNSNEKKWLNNEGVQGTTESTSWFRWSKTRIKKTAWWTCERDSERNTPIHPIQRTRRRRNQQFEGLEEYNYKVDRWTGWRSYPSKSQGNLRHPTSSSTQRKQHDDRKSNKSWNSWRSSPGLKGKFLFVQRFFRLPEIWIPWQSTGSVDRYTCARHIFITCTVIAQNRRHVFLGSRGLRAQDELFAKNIHSSTRSCFTLRLTVQWTRALVLSHLPLLCYCRPLLRTQTCCPRIICPLWRSTAGWYFYGISLFHRQRGEFWQEKSDSVSNKNCNNPSWKFWHLPVCLNCKSEKRLCLWL